jgi:hypothetical protein
MKLRYLSPIVAYKLLDTNLDELSKYRTYKKIIIELNAIGKLDEIGFRADENGNLYLGINLNPELLLYSETSQESVELKLVSEKMNKYNDFLTKEGILDSIKVDYERVQNEEFYGYILQISYNFVKYKKNDLVYAISYLSALCAGLISAAVAVIR